MYNFKQLRDTMQGRIRELGEVEGRRRFVQEIHESVGLLVCRDGSSELTESLDGRGRRVLAPNRISPYEFSLKMLAEAIGGRDFVESFNPMNAGPDAIDLIEAGPGIDPTVFINTNTFTAAVGGLLHARVMEGYVNNKFIGDQLFETIPTNLNGEKIPGTFGFGSADGDNTRKPGEAHPRLQFGERWIETPELEEKAGAVEVTQEAVFYDRTLEVLKRAGDVGEILGYGKEKTQLRLFSGALNSYSYGGTSYNTYQASTPWINDHTNVAEDYSDIDNANALLENMTDPETGREILVDADTIVHAPRKDSLWHRILNSTETRETTNTSLVTIASPPPSVAGKKRLQSTILRNIIDNELGVTQAQAADWWYYGQPTKCFKWMEAWPLRIRKASPAEFVMLDRGLVAAFFANYRAAGSVWEPRYMVRNKN